MSSNRVKTWEAYLLSFIGVCIFALTLPMTKLALKSFSPYFITVGRVAISGSLAAMVLFAKKTPRPERIHWPKLFLTGLGIAVSFPLCIGMALQKTNSSHAAIVLAILPLLTAVIGAQMNHEKHSSLFWGIVISGCSVVLIYTIWKNGIELHAADFWVLGAALSAAVGYNTGAFVSKTLGGFDTISWALALLLPVSLPVFIYFCAQQNFSLVTLASLMAFFYLAIMSQFLGFVPWYNGLQMGGVAKVSQVQLLQTFITLAFSALLLSETITVLDWTVAGAVVLLIFISKRVH